MKLRNLFFALFLVIGAIGFTACTGDDGAQGEKGEQGEKGDSGDPGDGSGGVSSFYDFLTSWGSETGEVACDDSLLTGEGPLPGPALKALAAGDRTGDSENMNSPVLAECSTALFGAVGSIDVGGDEPVAIAGATSHMVLWKAGRAMEKDDPVRKPADDFGLATSTVETRDFVGGPIFATLLNNGPDEALERELLRNQCGVGTDPPSIVGEWKSVQKTSSITTYTNMEAGDPADTITLLKVCVVLDAHPGVTKCFVKETVAGETTMQIAIYDGANLDTVIAGDDDNFPEDDAGEQADLFTGADDFVDVERLCGLFGLN